MAKRLLLAVCAMVLFSSLPLAAETVEGYLVDQMCSGMVEKKGVEGVKAHTKECALMDSCKNSGFTVVTADGKVFKFDKTGNEKAVALLEGSDKEDNIKVSVEGKVSGDSIAVTSLKLP